MSPLVLPRFEPVRCEGRIPPAYYRPLPGALPTFVLLGYSPFAVVSHGFPYNQSFLTVPVVRHMTNISSSLLPTQSESASNGSYWPKEPHHLPLILAPINLGLPASIWWWRLRSVPLYHRLPIGPYHPQTHYRLLWSSFWKYLTLVLPRALLGIPSLELVS